MIISGTYRKKERKKRKKKKKKVKKKIDRKREGLIKLQTTKA
jgi:hypothetical protein